MGCKKNFLLQQKNSKYFCTGCPKSALRGGKTKFFDFFFKGASAIKIWEKSRIFRYGLPEDFFNRGQKTTAGGAYSAPSPPMGERTNKQENYTIPRNYY